MLQIDVFLNELDVNLKNWTHVKKISKTISELKDDISNFDNNFENNDFKNDDFENDNFENDDVKNNNVRDNNIENNKIKDVKKDEILNYIF